MKKARHKRLHVIFFHVYEISRIDQSTETEQKLVVASSRGEGQIGSSCLAGLVSLWRDKDIPELDKRGPFTAL